METKPSIEEFNIATLPIADKVNNNLQARFYEMHLALLQKAAKQIGGTFAQCPQSDCIPPEVEDYLTYSVMVGRAAYLYPLESEYKNHRTVEDWMNDGYGVTLLREILAALDGLGIRFRVQGGGYDWIVIKEEIERREKTSKSFLDMFNGA
jgi:hypothetical protein